MTERSERTVGCIRWLGERIRQWRAKRRAAAALQRYGWDGKCPGCGRWMHAEACARLVGNLDWHWVYECGCGERSAWFLGFMFPMYDDGTHGWPDWRAQMPPNDNSPEKSTE